MENPCKIIFFGDSITKGYAPIFEDELRREYPEIALNVINAGVESETSRDGLARLEPLLDQKPNVAVIGFGMNDWRKGVSRKEYKKNLVKMLDAFEAVGTRVIINTVNPSYDFQKKRYNCEVDEYSQAVREIAYEKRIKIADINARWKCELNRPQKGLRDELHPNLLGYRIMCKALMHIVPRRNTTVLWQYNSHHAKCNYRCPYCYYLGLHSPTDQSFGTIEEWHEGFKGAFGNQHLTAYLGFGEPSLGRMFPEIVDMFGSEANWELRIISNISTKELRAAARSALAQDGRFHIAGSFHPSMTTREEYLSRLKYFRDQGIEVPTVYVAYPPYLSHFEEDIQFFRKEGFMVHVRRFIGRHGKKTYPAGYTEDERGLISKYQDDGMLKYMQSDVDSHGELTYSGVHFFVADSVGNVGYDIDLFEQYTKYRCIFGNIHQRNFKPLLLPGPYPGTREGTDDGVANVISRGYKELEGNHVISFARQGGVYRTDEGDVVYGNEFKDFTNPKTRAEYHFPPRDLKDVFAYSGRWRMKMFNVWLSNKKLMRNVVKVMVPPKSRRAVKAKITGRA